MNDKGRKKYRSNSIGNSYFRQRRIQFHKFSITRWYFAVYHSRWFW